MPCERWATDDADDNTPASRVANDTSLLKSDANTCVSGVTTTNDRRADSCST